MSFVDAIKKSYEDNGAEYLGAILSLKVAISDDEPVEYNSFRQALLNAGIEEDQILDPMDELSVYLQTVSRVANTAVSKLEIPGDVSFDKDAHRGYKVDKLFSSRDHEKIRAVHKLFWFERVNEDFDADSDGTVEDVDSTIQHEEILVYLLKDNSIRIKRIPNTVEYATLPPKTTPSHFIPFLLTLESQFQDKIRQYYSTPQITHYMRNLIFQKIGVDKMFRGLFFVHHTKMDLVSKLQSELKACNRGIKLFTMPVVRYPDNEAMNDGLEMIQDQMYESLEEELLALIDDINDKLEKQEGNNGKYGTRTETWVDRYSQAEELARRVRTYKSEQLLMSEGLDFLLEEAKAAALKGMAG